MIKLFLSILLLGSFAGGNLGCSTKGLVLDERKIQYFVEANQNDLKREMAKGYGDKLSTLAALNGCMDDNKISAFNAKAKEQFQTSGTKATASPAEFTDNIKYFALSDVCQGS